MGGKAGIIKTVRGQVPRIEEAILAGLQDQEAPEGYDSTAVVFQVQEVEGEHILLVVTQGLKTDSAEQRLSKPKKIMTLSQFVEEIINQATETDEN